MQQTQSEIELDAVSNSSEEASWLCPSKKEKKKYGSNALALLPRLQ